MDEEITRKVLEIISNHLGIPKDELDPKADLVKDLNIQRLEIAELLNTMENEFNIRFPQEKIGEIQTLEDIITLVSDNLL